MRTLKEQLDQFEIDHAFLRQLVIPEEDRCRYTSAVWNGEYRWFRAENVICLEKLRRLKSGSDVSSSLNTSSMK